MSAGAKSPLTGAYGESEVGGLWGTELRRAGWDGVVIEGRSAVDESMLTGESLPVEKNEPDKVFSGSIIKQGETDAVITATGAKTYFGNSFR